MNTGYPPKYDDIIEPPLWDLMLSTNDCHPGCSCDDDYFQITEERIGKWIEKNSDLTDAVRIQINALCGKTNLDIDALTVQTNINFGDMEEINKWLNEWKKAIDTF